MALSTFEDLTVWQRSCELAVAICREVQGWRRFALRDQLQRSAIFVPSNIGDGQERDSPGDFSRFLRISKGSNAELRTQISIAERLGLITEEAATTYLQESKEISAMLQSLIRSIESRPPRREGEN